MKSNQFLLNSIKKYNKNKDQKINELIFTHKNYSSSEAIFQLIFCVAYPLNRLDPTDLLLIDIQENKKKPLRNSRNEIKAEFLPKYRLAVAIIFLFHLMGAVRFN